MDRTDFETEHPHERGEMTLYEVMHLLSDMERSGITGNVTEEQVKKFFEDHPYWAQVPMSFFMNTAASMRGI